MNVSHETLMGAVTGHRRRRDANLASKFVITLERDEDGIWIAEYPSIPGCIS
jgi:hypothetical protein